MTTLSSRPLAQLGCPTIHFLTSFLLSETDLVGLGCWEAGHRDGLTPTAWCRGYLHVAVQCREEAARRVTDLLDLRYIDEIADVRAKDAALLDLEASHAYGDPARARGLLWALLTDPRDAAHAAGTRLMTEVYVRALRDLGAPPPAR